MSNELLHFGILGQKWGVRRWQNKDGTLTEEGKAHYRNSLEEKTKLAKAVQRTGNFEYSYGNIKKHPVIKDVIINTQKDYDEYKKHYSVAVKEEKNFYKNKELYEKYLNKAVDMEIKTNPKMLKTWGNREEIYDWYKNDDGDQGPNSSIELFKKSKEGKKLDESLKAASKAYTKFKQNCRNYISEIMGEYGETPVNEKYPTWTINRDITRKIEDILFYANRDKSW